MKKNGDNLNGTVEFYYQQYMKSYVYTIPTIYHYHYDHYHYHYYHILSNAR